jgi:hypothetical protein
VKNKKFLAVVLCVCLAATGCLFSTNTLAQIEKWEPVAAQAFTYIVSILEQDGVIKIGTAGSLDTAAATVTGDFGQLGSDITAALASTSAATGALNKTIAVLTSIQTDLGQFNNSLTGLNIPTTDLDDAKQSVGGLIVAIGIFEAQLTPVASLPLDQQRAALKKVKIPSVDGFRKQFNLIQVSHNHPEKQL